MGGNIFQHSQGFVAGAFRPCLIPSVDRTEEAAPAAPTIFFDSATQRNGPFTLSESNLRAYNTGSNSVDAMIRLNTTLAASGSTYFEMYVAASTPLGIGVGITDVGGAITRDWWGSGSTGYLFYFDGRTYHNGSSVYAVLGTYGTGSTVGILVKNAKLYVSINGTWSGDPDAETGAAATGLSGNYYPGIFSYGFASDMKLRLSASSMAYPIPTGASTLVP